MTISSFATTEPDVCALAPRTTMPSERRSTTRRYEVGVVLLGRALAAVALDVGDGRGRHDLLALEAPDVAPTRSWYSPFPSRARVEVTTYKAASSSRPIVA